VFIPQPLPPRQPDQHRDDNPDDRSMAGIIVAAPDRVKFYAMTALDQDVRFGRKLLAQGGDSHLSKINRRRGESEKNLFTPVLCFSCDFFQVNVVRTERLCLDSRNSRR
jgi:hypothetical protein